MCVLAGTWQQGAFALLVSTKDRCCMRSLAFDAAGMLSHVWGWQDGSFGQAARRMAAGEEGEEAEGEDEDVAEEHENSEGSEEEVKKEDRWQQAQKQHVGQRSRQYEHRVVPPPMVLTDAKGEPSCLPACQAPMGWQQLPPVPLPQAATQPSSGPTAETPMGACPPAGKQHTVGFNSSGKDGFGCKVRGGYMCGSHLSAVSICCRCCLF
jgi:hypothetical protein